MIPIQQHRLGAANEHLIAHSLLARGDDVFWPAVQASHVDLLYIRRGRINYVQVKSAYRYRGQLVVRTHAQKYAKHRLDWLGVVDKERRAWLIPWSALRGRQTLRMTAAFEKWRIA